MSLVRALLVTDVVDSTALSEKLGEARMAQVWAAHDRLARDLLRVHGGREIDKTDGFLLLFESVPEAAAYALAYHGAIARSDPPLQARVGLHVGPVILTENRAGDVALGAKMLEVDGVAKPTASRVMSLARGGQTLLTADARDALGPTDLRVGSHGHWRMKGLAEPLELFEVCEAGATLTPPSDAAKVWRVVWRNEAWVPLREVKHSLPRERDAFVGRQSDLRALADRLDAGAALVSVLGTGGTGKTRLVVHYGWTWLGEWPGGVWFCDLSEARSVDGIVAAVARALDVAIGTDDAIAQVGHALAVRGRCLVLLDNFEQVARHAPETLGRWLDRASEAQFVVTSREVLGLPGENALALAPLVGEEAVDLFVARAVQAKRDFVLDAADREHVTALAKLLDGLPLAIELAAARVRVMAPKVLLQRISERFKLLASSGGRHTRQATLRGALDWSWNLLSEDEQRALTQVSVFEGGFTLEGAEAVLSLAEAWPADAVQALVDKSLARRVSDERFDLLVSVQEYASEKLAAAAGQAAAEARHGAHYARYGREEALDGVVPKGGPPFAAELDNLLAACRRAVRRGDGDTAAATLRAAWEVLRLQSPMDVGADLATAVLGVSLTPQARGAVEVVLAQALRDTGRFTEARAHYDAALALFRETGARRSEGIVLNNLGTLDREQNRPDASRAHFDAALAVLRAAGERRWEAITVANLGNLHRQQRRVDEALVHSDAALAVAREIGDRRLEGAILGNLGILYRDQGRLDEARACVEAAMMAHREVGDRRFEAQGLVGLAGIDRDLGRSSAARTGYEAALVLVRELGDRRLEAVALGSLGALRHEQGAPDEARGHYEAALAGHREVGNRRGESSALGDLAVLHAEQGRPDEARALYEAALAMAREVGNRHTEGSVLGNLGLLHQRQGRFRDSRAHLDAALGVHREAGDRQREGVVLGSLAALHLQLGELGEARARSEEAVAVLRGPGHRLALAEVLCGRARLEVTEGRPDAARAALRQAEALAAACGAGPDGELHREIGRTRAALDALAVPDETAADDLAQ